jgi:hypothetical protein
MIHDGAVYHVFEVPYTVHVTDERSSLERVMACSTLPTPFASMENDTFLNTERKPLDWGEATNPAHRGLR